MSKQTNKFSSLCFYVSQESFRIGIRFLFLHTVSFQKLLIFWICKLKKKKRKETCSFPHMGEEFYLIGVFTLAVS